MEKVFAIYSRKSRFTGKGESVENQIEMCREYLRIHFGEEEADKAVIYEDEGFSGKNLDRPQFKTMFEDIKNGKISAVLCYRLDRISRNIGDFANLITELTSMDVAFISIKEQFDTNSPMGRAMMYIASVFSQLERETIAERIRDNLHELSKTGRWLGGVTPTGYSSVGETSMNINGKTKKTFHLAVKEDEMQIVKLIFNLFLEHNSLTACESYLLAHNYKTKNDRDFTRFSIRGILTNPVYMIADSDAFEYFKNSNVDLYSDEDEFDGTHGMMVYNRTLQEQGKATKIKPMEEWIASVGKHQGFINGKDWIKVQTMLDRNKSKSYRKPKSHTALLSGILKCECGEFMRPHMTTRMNRDGEYTYYYSCNMKLRSKGSRCNNKNINGNEIDKEVIATVKALASNGDDYFVSLKSALSESKIKAENISNEQERLEEEIEKKEKEIEALVNNLSASSGTGAEKYILDKINTLSDEVEKIKSQMNTLSKECENELNLTESIDLMKDMLKSFSVTVDNMTIEQKRQTIRTFVKEIIWDGENAHIVFFGSDYEYPFKKTEMLADDDNLYPLGEDRK
ncbi:MAG: recombinase family protein [Eubacterium sp.]|nr:recombinase family protein [Eubacterium sp.]